MMPILKNSQHVENLLSKLADSTDLCDIILVAGNDNEKIPAHRLILNEYEYFRALLSPQFRDGSQDEITLQAIDGSTLKSVKKFLYTGCIEITEENVRDVIHAASGFGLTALRELCCGFCVGILSVANCIDNLLLAELYDLEELTTKAIQFIHEHIESIAGNDFQKMNKQLFKKMLEDRHEMESEIVVFDRLEMWIKSNESELTEVHSELEAKSDGNYSELLELIRLKKIADNELKNRVQPFFKKYGIEHLVWKEFTKRYHKKIKDDPVPKRLCNHNCPYSLYYRQGFND